MKINPSLVFTLGLLGSGYADEKKVPKLDINPAILPIVNDCIELQHIADTYLQDSLKMNPKIKTCKIITDFTAFKKRIGDENFAKRYRLLDKKDNSKNEDIWVYQYQNKVAPKTPQLGNALGQAKLLINIKTKKVIGVWRMPK